MNCLLVGLALAAAAVTELPVGTELQYSGSLTQQSKNPTSEAKTFTVTALSIAAEDGPQLVWSVEERGSGGWSWPERFGSIPLATDNNSKAQPIRVLFTHDGLPHPIGIRSPLFEFQDKLAADANWSDGRLEYRVTRKRKIKDRECWQIEVASNLGRAQTLLIDAASGVLVSNDQRVFMGRGDEFQLKMELQSQKTLAAPDVAKSQAAFVALRQLQSSLGRTGEQKVVELTAIQLKSAQESIGSIEKQAEGTMWSKLAGIIGRDLQQQARRLEGAAGLAKKFVGQPAPKSIFKLADGSTIPATEVQGKVVVLHFWEYRHENLTEPYGQIGYLDFLNGKRKKLGVKVIGVNVDPKTGERENAGAAIRSMKKLMEFMNLAYDVAVDDGTLLSSYGDPRTLGSPLPLWVVIGHDGKIAHYHIGYYNITPDKGLEQLDEAVINALRKQREAQ
ncbi:MAG: TlpA family protein disulfide reductase [Planctomycetes bacterium]|nr:TlpA family protein disulfide reductase [Planctomycetota bacterium]